MKKARKSYPDNGIEKGDSYYWWKFRYGGKIKSKTPPRASQLTQSDKLSRVYSVFENIEDADDLDSLREAIEEGVSELNDVASEYRESAESIRDTFGDTDQTQDCDDKADSCESAASELENIDTNYEEVDSDDEPSEDELAKMQAFFGEVKEEATGVQVDF